MLNWSTVGTLILGSGGLITGVLALLSSRSSKNKIDSETQVNIASAAQSHEMLVESRETFWRKETEFAKEAFEVELVSLKKEVAWMRILIKNHVPWDWEVVRQLKLAGIEVSNPPTLNYVKGKYSSLEEA